MNNISKNKIVYILGAGFSCPAQIPLQANLLKEIFEYETEFGEAKFLEAREKIELFINDLFGDFREASIEDIFTVLDRCIVGKERFKRYDWKTIYELRTEFIYLILFIINYRFTSIPQGIYKIYKKFAQHLIDKRHSMGQEKDTLAIVSSNWDTILEYFISQSLSDNNKKNTSIDYCTYTHSFSGKNIPHVNIKTAGKFNLKFLKLHGSLNWLFCSNCGRLFIDDKNIGLDSKICTYCEIEAKDKSLLLEPLIITPTFLKELTNLHIKNIWQNAFLDIQEASEIIFIGYSLPPEDYEMKYMLKKAINRNSKIEAILTSSDENNGTSKRYKSFFGNHVKFYFDGFEQWVKKKI